MTPEAAVREIFASTWETEKRVGVDHYKPKQAKAAKIEESDETSYIVGWTPTDGHGINAVFCDYDDGWKIVVPVIFRVDGFGQSTLRVPDGFELADFMIEALDSARA